MCRKKKIIVKPLSEIHEEYAMALGKKELSLIERSQALMSYILEKGEKYDDVEKLVNPFM